LPHSPIGDSKEEFVNALFARVARRYDHLNDIISLRQHRRWRRIAVRVSGVRAGDVALDVATGTGDFAAELARAVGGEGGVVGVDFCETMLDLARRKLAALPQASLVRARAENLPFTDGAFDCVTTGFALRNVSDIRKVVSEMARVTRPGGRVVSLEIVGPEGRLLRPFWRLYFQGAMPRFARLFGGDPEAYGYLPDSVDSFCSRAELADVLRECGLVDVRITNLALGTVCIHRGTRQ
jgi:demethylmenaquinone methyltransferase/2-methoxy-6-polyprenyl-1,4-benzoquinol methylase